MASQTDGVYVGIDINNKNTVISFYKQNMKEPSTISTVMGQENFLIPTYVSKKKGIGQWFFGEEAIRRVKTGEAVGVEDLYEAALADVYVTIDGNSVEARELLVIYFKKLFSLPGFGAASLEKVIICVEQVSLEVMELLTHVVMKLGIPSEKLTIIDHRESFYYYSLSQTPDLFLYNIALFDYSGTNLVGNVLSRNTGTRPQVVNIDQVNFGELSDSKDEDFEKIVDQLFDGKIFSSVYLVGDGFDGDWMKTSLTKLCKGKKVFLGKNLYSKGACYAGFIKDGGRDWPFIFFGDNELKLNLSIKVLDGNELKFYSLIEAGESWYEAKGECEVILDGENEVEFWIQRPESREAHVEVLELTDMPERENRTTRLRISALPVSDKEIGITIMDLGFGEICPSSGKTWEHVFSLN